MANDLFCGRAHDQVAQTSPPVGREDDQVAVVLPRVVADLQSWMPAQDGRDTGVIARMGKGGDEPLEVDLHLGPTGLRLGRG